MSAGRAKLERKIRGQLQQFVTCTRGDQLQEEIVKLSEEMAGDQLRLGMTYFWLGIIFMAVGQLIYRVVL